MQKDQERLPISIIYAITGWTGLFEVEECREAGFDDFFAKPVHLEVLFRLLKMPLRNLSAGQEDIPSDNGFREGSRVRSDADPRRPLLLVHRHALVQKFETFQFFNQGRPVQVEQFGRPVFDAAGFAQRLKQKIFFKLAHHIVEIDAVRR